MSLVESWDGIDTVDQDITIKFFDFDVLQRDQPMHLGSISKDSMKKTKDVSGFCSKCTNDCMMRSILVTQSKMLATNNLHCELYFPRINLTCTVNMKEDGMVFYYPMATSRADRNYVFATFKVTGSDYRRMIMRLETLQQTKFDMVGFFCYPLVLLKGAVCCTGRVDFEDYTNDKITCARMVFLALSEISGINMLGKHPDTVTPDDIKCIIDRNFSVAWGSVEKPGFTRVVGRLCME